MSELNPNRIKPVGELGRTPTTFEMDGLYTEEDIANRNKLMVQCRDCNKWTQQQRNDRHEPYKPCGNCGSKNYDIQSAKSLRSFNILTDSKRKPKK